MSTNEERTIFWKHIYLAKVTSVGKEQMKIISIAYFVRSLGEIHFYELSLKLLTVELKQKQ